MVWMMAAFAAEPTMQVQIVVEGETLAVYHGAYCSFPRVPGITSRISDVEPPNIDWDHAFDIEAAKKPFSGLIMGDPAFGALPLQVNGDITLPEPSLIRQAIAACEPEKLDRPGLEELLRKSDPAGRSLFVRHLLNKTLKARRCALAERPKLMELALECATNAKCGDYLERLDSAGARCK